jgi:hypothetical protein
MRPTFACGILGTCESLLVFWAAVKGEALFVSRAAVNPSMDAASNTFRAFAILRRAESR